MTDHPGASLQPAAVPETQWNSRWMSNPTYLQYNQLPNSDPGPIFEFNLQQEGSIGDSINWISPSSEIWKDWDCRFSSLADPALPSGFAPFFGAPPIEGGLNLELNARQWNQNAQMDFVPAGAAVVDGNSPSVQSTTQSTLSAGGPTSSVAGSEESRSYIDSVGARGTMQRLRRKRNHSNVEDENSQSHCPRSDATSLTRTAMDDELRRSTHWVSSDLYNEVVRNVQFVGVESPSQFDPATFPSILIVNKLCQLYFDHFHPDFPFMQKLPFRSKNEVWILIIATVTIGAQYTTSTELREFKDILAQILRRGLEAIIHGKLPSDNTTSAVPLPGIAAADNITVIQARILSSVIMIHSGNLSFMEKALSDFTSLVTATGRMHLLQPVHGQTFNKSSAIELQLRSRAGYMIWVSLAKKSF
jgi:hypothetical protein